MEKRAVQVNIPEKYTSFCRPYSFFHVKGKKYSRATYSILGVIATFSRKAAQECTYSYERFENELNLSRSAVAQGLKELREDGVISRRFGKASAAYRLELNFEGSYIQTPQYLYTMAFSKKGETAPCYLTKAQVDVLSFFRSHKEAETSVSKLAGILDLSESTVQTALKLLIELKLIFRKACGMNGHALSVYVVNEKLLRKSRKAQENAQRAEDKRNAQEKAADERTDRERYYARLHDERERRKEYFQGLLDADEAYSSIHKQLKRLEIEAAKASVFTPNLLPALEKQVAELTVRESKRMSELGITLKDFETPPLCIECNDTGTRKDGTLCTCWRCRR